MRARSCTVCDLVRTPGLTACRVVTEFVLRDRPRKRPLITPWTQSQTGAARRWHVGRHLQGHVSHYNITTDTLIGCERAVPLRSPLSRSRLDALFGIFTTLRILVIAPSQPSHSDVPFRVCDVNAPRNSTPLIVLCECVYNVCKCSSPQGTPSTSAATAHSGRGAPRYALRDGPRPTPRPRGWHSWAA